MAQALVKLTDMESKWQGTTKELLSCLNRFAGDDSKSKDWPQTPHALGHRLRRLQPSLRKIQIHIEKEKRVCTVRKESAEGAESAK